MNDNLFPVLPDDFYRKGGTGVAGDALMEVALEKPNHRLTHISFDGGVYIYVENGLYPKSSFPTPQSIYAIDIVKKMFIELVHLTSSWQFIFSVPFILLSYKKFFAKCLRSWTRIAEGAMADVFISDKYQTEFVKHVTYLVSNAIIKAGYDERHAMLMGDIVSHILYYDSAYYNRFIDLAIEVKELNLILDMRKEIKRITKIFMERETNPATRIKTQRMLRIFHLLMWIPSFKRTVRDILTKEADWKTLRGTEADKYWMWMFSDYNYSGKTYEERMDFFKEAGIPVPNLYLYDKQI